jgi:Melibiase/Alpha galactosidase C-terminal beta sandwich domain
MNNQRPSGSLIVLLALGWLTPAALGGSMVIENARLSLSYDSTVHRFAVKDRATRKTVLAEGQLLNAPVARTQSLTVQDAVFGKGHQVLITYADGAVSRLELYPELPFLLVKTDLHNSANAETDVEHVAPVRFTVDLEKPAAELRTLGTAGLTTPDKNPGSYLFLTLADPATRRGVVAGWLTQDRGSGVLFSSVQDGKVEFRAQIDYGHLRIPPDASSQIETLAVGLFEDARIGEEMFADAVARQYQIKLHPQINGYCTWYSNPHGGAADEKSIVELAEAAARELKPFGFSFIQIDDKWQDGVERNGPARRFYRVKPDGPYPTGIKPVSDKLHELGLTTGLWFLPFASDYQDPEFKDRQDWFVKRQDGKPYETPWGNTALDLTQPEVRTYLSNMVQTVHSWGVNYFKMDGLWTGTATEQIYVNDGYRDDHMGDNAPFHDPNTTNIEALRDGLKLLRQAAGPDVFFSGCNLSQNMRSLAGCIGLVDSMRIGPDNGQGWRDYREEIARNASGSIITGPVRGSRLYFMHGRLWWNDPDPCYVRSSIPLNHARLITSWVAVSGQFNLNSDWIPGLPAERLEVLKRTMPHHGVTARPVDYFDSIMPAIWLVTDTRQQVRRDVLGLFNWESSGQSVTCSAAKVGLASAKSYHVFDFWADKPVPSFSGEFSFEVPAQSCRVLAVRPEEGHPVLVSTSRHVTQGIVDITGEKWIDSSRTFSATSQIVANDPYQLRIAGLNANRQQWKLASATVSAADQAAGVTIAPKPAPPDEVGWLRLTITSTNSRAITWTLKFSAE